MAAPSPESRIVHDAAAALGGRTLPIHGYIVPFADLVAAAGTSQLNSR